MGQGKVFHANRFVAHGACEMHMVTFVFSTMAEAVFLHAGAIIDQVKQMVFGKEGKRTVDGGVVGIGQLFHYVLQGEGVVHLLAQSLIDK